MAEYHQEIPKNKNVKLMDNSYYTTIRKFLENFFRRNSFIDIIYDTLQIPYRGFYSNVENRA